MRLIGALCHHAWLVLSLRHDGKGMPKELPAAFALAITYCFITLVNSGIAAFQFETICALISIVQLYVFLLRNTLIGLLIFISIVTNCIHFLCLLIGLSEIVTTLLAFFEYIMVFFAITNMLKSELQTLP